jgi:predicted regulator of Ras-like GTPase activity (Roadblock/LC7/MglB family)
MSIEKKLETTFARIAGCKCIVLIGGDGLIVQAAGEVPPAYETIFVELMVLFNKVSKLLETNGLRDTNAVSISGQVSNFFLSRVSDNYFLFLAVNPMAIAGKCKYELVKAAIDLKDEVS